MSGGSRSSLYVWFASRAGVLLAALYGAWALTGSPAEFFPGPESQAPAAGLSELWNRWDLEWYASIAQDGYVAPGHENNPAFLPLFPLFLRFLGMLGMSPTIAGLLVSLIAGSFAAVALGRLTHRAGGAPELGVVAWVAAPMAVFLAAPYTEALFAAFAFSAWLFARDGRWAWAAVLSAAASLTRVNGLFLTAALVVMLLTQQRERLRSLPWLTLPFAAVAGYVLYLWSMTGSWTTWFDVQEAGWGRTLTAPWDAWQATWAMAFDNGAAATFAVQYRIELLAMVVALSFAVYFLIRRYWAEFTFVALTCAALGTSTLFYSVPRSLLTLLPIWVALGVWMSRYRSVLITYVSVSAPLMIVGVIAFTSGRWVA